MNLRGALRRLLGFNHPVSNAFPRQVAMKTFLPTACRFEISCDVEAYRIEQFGEEEEFTRLILADLHEHEVFFDIGACVGLVTVHAAVKGAEVYAFEPDPYYRSRLSLNLSLNGLTDVHVFDWAVADREGTSTLFTDGAGGKSPSLRQVGARGSVEIKISSIDIARSLHLLPAADVVKLDIEGAEILALRGMAGLLASAEAPRAIFVELHPDFLRDFGSSISEISELFKYYGYACVYDKERSGQIHRIYRK